MFTNLWLFASHQYLRIQKTMNNIVCYYTNMIAVKKSLLEHTNDVSKAFQNNYVHLDQQSIQISRQTVHINNALRIMRISLKKESWGQTLLSA